MICRTFVEIDPFSSFRQKLDNFIIKTEGKLLNKKTHKLSTRYLLDIYLSLSQHSALSLHQCIQYLNIVRGRGQTHTQ